MTAVKARDFQLGTVRAVLYTSPEGFSAAAVMRSFFPAAPEFDGDPKILGDETVVGLPPEVPRVQLRATSGRWQCQISPARIDVLWNRIGGEKPGDLSEVLDEAASLLKRYGHQMKPKRTRVAVVVTRYVSIATPGLFLAHHFCQDRWHREPLNRPASFELHAHKSYDLKGFSVNSWFRAKSGMATDDGVTTSVVLTEQDLNTIPGSDTLSDDQVSAFYTVCPPELDHILALYFPEAQ